MENLIRFQTDRDLHKKSFVLENEVANIFEELLEAGGLDVPKDNRPELKAELEIFIQSLIAKSIATEALFGAHDQVDAFADIITFATGAILKLGHNPLIAIAECGKEVNSRVGVMVDGKFEKDLSDEAKSNWYTADYNKSELMASHSEATKPYKIDKDVFNALPESTRLAIEIGDSWGNINKPEVTG